MHGPPNESCLNCETLLYGRWCHDCGQHAHGNHRSMVELGREFVEMVSHADGRLWRTIRRLLFDPAGLTTDYLSGHRASEIPPLRLFFVMLFLLFTVGSLTQGHIDLSGINPELHQKIAQKLNTLTISGSRGTTFWLRAHLEHALDRPDTVLAVMREWAERFTFMMLPIAACVLWVLYLPQRVALYDHMIFSIHSICFCCVVLIGLFLLSPLGDLTGWLLLLPLVHLFVHLRGVHRSGVFGTLSRMAVLGVVSSLAFLFLVVGLAGLGLELGAK